MNWPDVGKWLTDHAGDGLNLVGSLLTGNVAGAVAAGVDLVKSATGKNEPDAALQALQSDPQTLARLREAQLQHEVELQRIALQMRQAELQAYSQDLATVNGTIQAEAASQDAYVRRWRPTWGYSTCATWVLQALALVAAVVSAAFVHPEHAGTILGGLATLMGALTTMWTVALAVLGINISKRSHDKQVAVGQAPAPGVLQAVARRIAGQ